MILVNEKVDHVNFGLGVIKKVKEHKIWIQFEDELRTRIFLYPEGFEKFLKAVNPKSENEILEELHIRQEQLEMERKEQERKAAELNDIKARLKYIKKKSEVKTKKRKS
jgi:hypothetical protein